MEVPMLFVQKDFIADNEYLTNIQSENSSNGILSVGNTLSLNKFQKLNNEFERLLEIYTEFKAQITYGSIIEYIGEENTFFNG